MNDDEGEKWESERVTFGGEKIEQLVISGTSVHDAGKSSAVVLVQL